MRTVVQDTRAVTPPATRRRGSSIGGGNVLVYGIALVVVAITISPVLYGVISGFRTNTDLSRNPSGWPEPWVLSNYSGVLSNSRFWGYALNSTMIALITTTIVVVAGVMAAYPLARTTDDGLRVGEVATRL